MKRNEKILKTKKNFDIVQYFDSALDTCIDISCNPKDGSKWTKLREKKLKQQL